MTSEFDKKRVLVTGGLGFIGSNLACPSLAGRPWSMRSSSPIPCQALDTFTGP